MNEISSKKEKIAIIGSGVVGRATGKGLLKMGHEVVFYDINPSVVNSLRQAGYCALHMNSLSEKTDSEIGILMVSVSTPTIEGQINLNHLRSALADLGKHIKKATNSPLVVLRSTLPPGTTESLAVPILEKFSEKKVSEGFKICTNPEFLREVSAEKDFQNPWMIVIGSDDDSAKEMLEKIYAPFSCPIVHLPIKESELMKYAHNLLNATKISFFNELRIVSEKIGINPDLVFPTVVKSAEAMWNPEYGIKNFGPYEGMCLPKDALAFFAWANEKLDLEMPLLKGTIQANELMKESLKETNRANLSKGELDLESYELVPVFKKAINVKDMAKESSKGLNLRTQEI